ncbi:MAG TPA: hypothetical protein ENK35_00835 [Candidatus Tenderia sp.]|nr:hypothetical protein [Candidatus Tenderia sp.]
MAEDAERVRVIAKEIEQYLTDHPEAADSVEGIASWWLPRQRIHYEVEMVKGALEYLQLQGIVSATGQRDAVYRLNKHH